MDKHLDASFAPLLAERWILDVDATVKPLYGHQEEARVGYNPVKPGRPDGVRLKISQLARDEGWRNADDGWYGMEGKVRLRGWTRARRILVFRRGLLEKLILKERHHDSEQIGLSGVELGKGKEIFEYVVLDRLHDTRSEWQGKRGDANLVRD